MRQMRMNHRIPLLLLTLLLGCLSPLRSQWNVNESVLSRHTWYKIGVTGDGIYALDKAALSAAGVHVETLDPNRIQLFGNLPGALPEANATERFDDLTEIALMVEGGEDGTFDDHDRILFYGSGPVNMVLNASNYYEYQRNPYSDTTYYFLCVDGETDGLRMVSRPSMATTNFDAVVSSFPDYVYHESEEISPYASGRTWYGDMITKDEGFKEFVFELPNIDKTQVLRIHSEVLGRCATGFPYSLRINDNLLVDQKLIDAFSDHTYGMPHLADKMFFTDTDRLPVRYELGPTEANPLLFIDYFVINCWRELKYDGVEMAFRVLPSQMVTDTVKVLLRGVAGDVVCWDVSNPLRPFVQEFIPLANNAYFGLAEHSERHYHLFQSSDIKPVTSLRPIGNQNLHGIFSTDFLIVTPRVFAEAAEALAAFHREEGLDCEVVDVEAVYNEFGTGIPDPTALRDFIRMVYLRSGGRMRYVLLMGKGTHDYRNYKGMDNNFVTTYQILEKPYHQLYSICCDDYFALMDEDEGKDCTGRVDLGLGRLPITTLEQGLQVVEKIKHYSDVSACHGPWKNEHLFMTDNDSRSYIDNAEKLDKVLDTAWHLITTKKLYFDSYPVVATPSGVRIPQAHEALMDYIDRGFLVMSYTGHGGTNSLSNEKVFTVSDVLAMRNYDQLPFVHTATCEFSEFDNPTVVSAGELMMLHPTGGAIALLTTVRPTIGAKNQQLSLSFHEHVYDMEDGQPLRFGDIYQRAKSDPKYYVKDNVAFVLFGDPALRLSYPERRVQTTKVNGNVVFDDNLFFAASPLSFSGQVTGRDGQIDALFNGVMNVRLYDKKSRYTSLGNYSLPRTYSFYENVLFEGKVTVKEGRFDFSCFLPANVNYESGNARLCYYAYDSLRGVDANGIFDDFSVGAVDPSAVTDHQGPDIRLYWNSPDFQSGDVVPRSGVLYADLFDEHGIDYYNVSIGRNIVMRSTLAEFDNRILDHQFKPAIDDYQRGRIALPVSNLSDGTYEFSLKAWDTQGNSTEVQISMVVEEGALLTAAYNYPNPFHGSTNFVVGHSDLTEDLSVRIEIFDLLGRKVTEINKHTHSEVGVVPPIEWNGQAADGHPLQAGLYVYRMTVTDEAGQSKSVTNRIIVE